MKEYDAMIGVRIVIGMRAARARKMRRALQDLCGLRTVGQAYSQLALFRRIRRELSVCPQPCEPLVVLTASFDRRNAEPMCARLLDEFPELVVYAIRKKAITRYSRVIHRKRLKTDELFAELSSLAAAELQLFDVVPSESQELDRD
jgi:hypothetical protein